MASNFSMNIDRLVKEFKKVGRYSASDSALWKELKGAFEGQRGFVIGNGPSLSASDLDLISGEVSIASNKIHLIFPKTQWRPNFYTVADPLVWEKISASVSNIYSRIMIPNYLPRNGVRSVVYWRSLINWSKKLVSSDFGRGAYGGYTVTYENIQLAMHLGLNPIYLLGCDHFYPGESKVKAGSLIEQGVEKTHFSEEYRKAGEVVLSAPIDRMNISYQACRDYSDKNAINIYNATRGGCLEVFERIDLDLLMSETS